VQVVLEGRKPLALAPRRQAKILVVDDETIQLQTAGGFSVHLGYEVDTMQSGLRACEVFSQAAQTGKSPYDLVVLDMLLNEKLDGFAGLRADATAVSRQKAIVASGHAPNERAELGWSTRA